MDDLSDRKHPNSLGYGKMAAAWYDTITEANSKGWIQSPIEFDAEKLPGKGLGYRNGS